MSSNVEVNLIANTRDFSEGIERSINLFKKLSYEGKDTSKSLETSFKQLNTSATDLQKAFNSLSIKSDFRMSQEKEAMIQNKHFFLQQFLEIRNSGISTPAEIARAWEAMNSKIAALGNLKVSSQMGSMVNDTEKVAGNVAKSAEHMKLFGLASIAAIAKIQILYSLINTTMSAIGSLPGIAIDAIESYNSSVVSGAAMITSMQTGVKDIGKAYKENKLYTEAVEKVLVKMDAETAASIINLRAMNDQFRQQGILIDTNNEKQITGFKSIANALAAITAGDPNQAMQFGQEIRAFRGWEDKGSNRLVQMLKSQGVTKEVFESWKQAGTVFEEMGKKFEGFAAAQGDINMLWATVKGTMITIRDDILRGGLSDDFAGLVKFMKELSEQISKNKEEIGQGFHKAWLAVKGTLESINALYKFGNSLLGNIGLSLGSIFDGWVMIGAVALPTVIEKFVSLWTIIKEIVRASISINQLFITLPGTLASGIISLGKAVIQATSGDFDGAAKTISTAFEGKFLDATKNIIANVKQIGTTIKSQAGSFVNLDSFDSRYAAYTFKKQKSGDSVIKTPKGIKTATTDRVNKPESVSNFNSIVEGFNSLNEKGIEDEAVRKSFDIEKKYLDIVTKFNSEKDKTKLAQEGITLATIETAKEDATNRAIKEISDKREKAWASEMKQFQEEASKKQRADWQEERNVAEDLIKIKLDEVALQQKMNQISEPDALKREIELKQEQLEVENEYLKTLDKSSKEWRTQEGLIRGVSKSIKEMTAKLPLKMVEEQQSKTNLFGDNFGTNNPFDKYTKSYKQTTDQIARLNAGSEEDKRKATALTNGMYLDGLRDSTAMASDILMKGNKDQFEAGKALAIAMATVNGALAITKALSTLPPPMSFVVAGLTAAMTGVQIATISSQQYEGREFGGPVNAGQSYIVGEKRAELFTPGASGVITPYVPSGGGATVNQQISIDARGADASVLDRINAAMKRAKEEAKSEILASMNRGGTFAKASGRI